MGIAQGGSGETAKGFPRDQLPTNKIILRFKGPFDYTYLYRTMQRWFEQRRFRFYETRIKDTGKRMKDDFKAIRVIDEFFSEQYDIKVEMWHLSSQEIMVNGEPRKIFNGMVQFTIGGSIKIDRSGWYGKSASRFVQWLGKRLIDARWREIEMKYIDTMEYRTQDIQTMLKECLGMLTKENAPW